MTRKNTFKKTFYFGLTLFLSPFIATGVILLLIFVNQSPKPKKVQVIKEVVFAPDNVIEHDTVYVEKPKPIVLPKITPKVVEPIKIDTVKVIDTSNQIN
jgi:hypothetical protein